MGGGGGGGGVAFTPVKTMLQLLLQLLMIMWHILDSRGGLKMKMAGVQHTLDRLS